MWYGSAAAFPPTQPCDWLDISVVDPRSWLNLQMAYDLRIAEISNAKRIAREVSPAVA